MAKTFKYAGNENPAIKTRTRTAIVISEAVLKRLESEKKRSRVPVGETARRAIGSCLESEHGFINVSAIAPDEREFIRCALKAVKKPIIGGTFPNPCCTDLMTKKSVDFPYYVTTTDDIAINVHILDGERGAYAFEHELLADDFLRVKTYRFNKCLERHLAVDSSFWMQTNRKTEGK